MKLVTLTGITKLPSVDIPPQGVSIGRELDNDVVTADEQASRYHAKITMDDGVWRLHDLKSRNGLYVNNKKVEGSAPLSLNDEIRIGRTALRFTDESGPAPHAPGEGLARLPSEATESGGPVPGSPAAKRSKRLRLLAVGLVTLLVLLVAAYAVQFLATQQHNTGTTKQPDAPIGAKFNDFELYYCKYEATNDNIFRYEVTLRAGSLHAVVDDLRNQRHEDKEVALTMPDLESLFKSLLSDEFLAQGPIPAMPSATGMKRSRLMVHRGVEGNALTVTNVELPPSAFAVTAATLERYVTDKLRIIDVPLDQRLKMATDKYAEARRLQLEREALPANLWKCIQAYDLVLVLLEGIQDPPPIYQDASANRFQAFHDLTAAIKQHESDAQIFERTAKLSDARAEYQKIIDMIPDVSNESYKRAHEKIVSLGMAINAANKRH